LRPAEIALLLKERLDTSDISATIVDLAVRGYLRIDGLPRDGSTQPDFQLVKLQGMDGHLLPYEKRLFRALFGRHRKVRVSDLRGRTWVEVNGVKVDVNEQAARDDHFFAAAPDSVAMDYRLKGFLAALCGVGVIFGFAMLFGAGLIGVPIVLAGLALMLVAPLMPKRTARGRVLYRRSLGFAEYLRTAERDRMRFAAEVGHFERYLPYAMVVGCATAWASAFDELTLESTAWLHTAAAAGTVEVATDTEDFSASWGAQAALPDSGRGTSGDDFGSGDG
jgi:hypothetical protein